MVGFLREGSAGEENQHKSADRLATVAQRRRDQPRDDEASRDALAAAIYRSGSPEDFVAVEAGNCLWRPPHRQVPGNKALASSSASKIARFAVFQSGLPRPPSRLPYQRLGDRRRLEP